jgi:hypothetical protein
MRRYGLHDDEWERIEDLLPGREGNVGVTAKDIVGLLRQFCTDIGPACPGGTCRSASETGRRFIRALLPAWNAAFAPQNVIRGAPCISVNGSRNRRRRYGGADEAAQ